MIATIIIHSCMIMVTATMKDSMRHGLANPSPTDSNFYAAWGFRHQSPMIPKAFKFARLQ